MLKRSLLMLLIMVVAHGICFGQPKLSGEIPHVSPELKGRIELLYSQDPGVRAKAASGIGELGEAAVPAIPFLVGMLGDTDPVLTRTGEGMESTSPAKEAVKSLARIGRPATDALLGALDESDADVRRNAVIALGTISDPKAVQPLIRALNDKNAEVKTEAIYALGNMRDMSAIGPLCDVMKERKSKITEASTEALNKIMDGVKASNTFEVLQTVSEKKDCPVRLMAIERMGALGEERSVAFLLDAVTDEERAVKLKAAAALGSVRDTRAVDALVSLLSIGDYDLRQTASKSLANMGAFATEPVIAALAAEEVRVRERAAWILGQMGDSRAVAPLASALSDDSVEVRAEAAKSLGNLKSPAAVDALLAALRDEDGRVRETALKALSELAPAAVEKLIFALTDDDIHIRVAAVSLLGETRDPKAVVPLIEALKDRSWVVRSEAAKSLGQIGDVRATEPLRHALNDIDSSVRAMADEALAKIEQK